MRGHVVPTLVAMDEIYALPREGGAKSARFAAYLTATRAPGGDALSGFNPMAGPLAAAAVRRLLELDAETVAGEAAKATCAVCDVGAVPGLAVVVAAPGMWTQRRVTEAEARLAPDRPDPAVVRLWAGEPCERSDVEREARAETARCAWTSVHGAARTLAAVLAREGLALALAGVDASPLREHEQAVVDAAVARWGDSTDRADILDVAYGDPLAAELGRAHRGLGDRAAIRLAHIRAVANIAAEGPAAALRRGAVTAR